MAASSGCSGKALVLPATCCVVDVIVDSASLGGEEMSLTSERELEVIRGGLTTVTNPNGTPGRRTLLLCQTTARLLRCLTSVCPCFFFRSSVKSQVKVQMLFSSSIRRVLNEQLFRDGALSVKGET